MKRSPRPVTAGLAMTVMYMRFRTIFLFLLLIELASLLAYFFPQLNTAGFFVIVLAVLFFSLKRLEYGLYFALAELILGGKGYLFSLYIGSTPISLRMGLFVVVMAAWITKLILPRKREPMDPRFHGDDTLGVRSPRRSLCSLLAMTDEGWRILKWWGFAGLAVVWGFAVGLLRQNNFGDLFLDANGYFYAALVLPWIWTFGRDQATNRSVAWSHVIIKNVMMIFITATTLVALKTLFVVYLFTHGNNNFISANLAPVYRWVRDTGVGEITWLPGNFARVFFQSQIYNVAAFFVFFVFILQRLSISGIRAFFYDRKKMRDFTICGLNCAVIIVSLSRSFWVGVMIGLGALIVAVAFRLPWRSFDKLRTGSEGRRYTVYLSNILLATLLFAAIIIFIIVRFPFPRPSAISLTETLEERIAVATEAAAASRWNLLPPLKTAILRHPIVGSGFGSTVTYISNDPRIREQNPTGVYTTYAFEWGWLDLWLKLGAVGMGLYLLFLFKLLQNMYIRARQKILPFAGFLVLISLIAINIFTPYLNHPLGFGILILATIILLAPKNLDEYAP